MTLAPNERPIEPERLRLRYELWLLSLFSLTWVGVFLVYAGWLPLDGSLELNLYRLYSVAAVTGWVAGNIYMLRRDTLRRDALRQDTLRQDTLRRSAAPTERFRKRLLLVYWVGPMSFLFLLRALAPAYAQAAAPFVPLYSACVFSLFFLVPVTLRATRATRLR